jgi:hypothetical protein
VALEKGYAPNMRQRTQRIAIGFVIGCFTLPNFDDGGIIIHKAANADHKGGFLQSSWVQQTLRKHAD